MTVYQAVLAPDIRAVVGDELYGIMGGGRQTYDKRQAIRWARQLASLALMTTYVIDGDSIVVAGPF